MQQPIILHQTVLQKPEATLQQLVSQALMEAGGKPIRSLSHSVGATPSGRYLVTVVVVFE